jgi:glycosyltransferase involved in cell wall biosynthesis
MKQLHIVQSISYKSAGMGYAALRYAEALAKSGNDITLFILDRSTVEFELDPNAPNLILLDADRSNFFELRNCILKENFDCVHIHGTWTILFAFACKWALTKKISIVVSPHGCLEPWAFRHKLWKKKIAFFLYQKWIFSKSSLLFATAMDELGSIRSLGIQSPVAVIPIGVDLPLAGVQRASPFKSFLFISRVHPIKGLPNLVSAWAKVRRDDWRIIIAGPDNCGHLKEVHEHIDRLGLGGDFIFYGLVTGAEKAKLFSEANIFVLPTHSENFGIVISEALSYGLPVITTKAAPWKDLETYDCGWWVVSSVVGLADALVKAMDSTPERLEEMGCRARKLIKEKYSWNSIGKSANEAYEWALDPNKKCPNFIYQQLGN